VPSVLRVKLPRLKLRVGITRLVEIVPGVVGGVIGVRLMKLVMPWGACMGALPGSIVMLLIDVRDWNRKR
jgi:hypothetical protein